MKLIKVKCNDASLIDRSSAKRKEVKKLLQEQIKLFKQGIEIKKKKGEPKEQLKTYEGWLENATKALKLMKAS